MNDQKNMSLIGSLCFVFTSHACYAQQDAGCQVERWYVDASTTGTPEGAEARLRDAIANNPESECRRGLLRRLFVLVRDKGDYTESQSICALLLAEARTGYEYLTTANSYIALMQQMHGQPGFDVQSMNPEAMQACRTVALQALARLGDLSAIPDDEISFMLPMKHVEATTETDTNTRIAKLRALRVFMGTLAARSPTAAEEVGVAPSNVTNELLHVLLRAGRHDEVLAELRALPDIVTRRAEGNNTRALQAWALLRKGPFANTGTLREQVMQILLQESNDALMKLEPLAEASMAAWHEVDSQVNADREKSLAALAAARTHIAALVQAREQLAAALAEPGPEYVFCGRTFPNPADIAAMEADVRYRAIKIAHYKVRDQEEAVAEGSAFLERFPQDRRAGMVRELLGL
jgi:hypothetical protein